MAVKPLGQRGGDMLLQGIRPVGARAPSEAALDIRFDGAGSALDVGPASIGAVDWFRLLPPPRSQ